MSTAGMKNSSISVLQLPEEDFKYLPDFFKVVAQVAARSGKVVIIPEGKA